ncbi:hypothetical protein PHYBOEH_000230 [Phytophthora boehmeriae]|uniref:Uncharacterized protein n=1 Tax=Phytophthora boehmeriae TaxID=109152 RepID=A0A8T1WWF6_9STRA|nr:hypothetical protein PHYBOEH_000230 [Phytophthora boehmeriae]
MSKSITWDYNDEQVGPIVPVSKTEHIGMSFKNDGSMNAHVDHISGTDQERDTAATTALKSTLLLQENGELAARLDDVKYLLDGILEPVKTQKGSIGRARSVLELTKLLQDQQIKQIVGLPSQRSLRLRVKEVLQTQLGVIMDDCGGAEEMHRVSLAVLTYFLSLSGEGEGYFDEKELDALVRALKHEVERESSFATEKDVLEAKTNEVAVV